MTLEYRRCIADLCMVHKIAYNSNGYRRDQNFFKFAQSRTRGSSVKLLFPRSKTNVRKSFFTNRGGSQFLRITKKLNISGPIKLNKFKNQISHNLLMRNGQLDTVRSI